jgi:transcriptional regulator with XRE-family HTH domain
MLPDAMQWRDLAPLIKKAIPHGDQAVLAAELKISPSTISNYLGGRRRPPLHVMLRLAERAGIELATGRAKTTSIVPAEISERLRELSVAALRVAEAVGHYGGKPPEPPSKPKSGPRPSFRPGAAIRGRATGS